MNDLTLFCKADLRRHKVRAATLNGLDYLEVSDDQRTLTVFFLGKAPEHIAKENVRIKGGQRITEIEVVDLEIHHQESLDVDDCMAVTVDRPGDFSTYKLCVVELDEGGQPTYRPLSGFDPRYACLDFSFKAGCPSDLDCKPQPVCPPRSGTSPRSAISPRTTRASGSSSWIGWPSSCPIGRSVTCRISASPWSKSWPMWAIT